MVDSAVHVAPNPNSSDTAVPAMSMINATKIILATVLNHLVVK